jgi:hypothetical protein
MLFSASRITQSAVLFGSLFAALFLTVMVVHGVEDYHRGKAVIGMVAFWGIFLAALWSTLKGRPGIALTPDGIIWRPLLGPNSFLPWPDIARCSLFMKYGRNNSKGSLAIGMNLVDSPSFQPGLLFRNRMKSSQLTNGWHFTYSAETMAAPLFWVSAVINYYLQHPDDRREIGTPAGLTRAGGLEVQNASAIPPPAM